MTIRYGTKAVTGEGGATIMIHEWRPEEGEILGKLLILHGMAEHGARYGAYATFLANNGLVVWAMDHRQHGLSINHDEVGIFNEKDDKNCMLLDVDMVVQSYERAYPEAPFIMMGHSMGSLIGRAYLQKFPFKGIATIIMGSPVTPLPLVRIASAMGSVVGKLRGNERSIFLDNLSVGGFNKAIKEPKTPFDWLSKNEEQVAAYAMDPLSGYPYNGYFYRTLSELAYEANLARSMSRFPAVPSLLISGDEDPCGKMGVGVKELHEKYKKYGIPMKMTLMKGMRHEVLNEVSPHLTHEVIWGFLEECLQN